MLLPTLDDTRAQKSLAQAHPVYEVGHKILHLNLHLQERLVAVNDGR